MVRRRTAPVLGLVAGLALALPAAATAGSGGGPAVDPPIVGVPMTLTQSALGSAADAVAAGKGADAIAPLTSARRNLLRSYTGAKYLIANAPPPPPAAAGSVNTRTFVKLARRSARASRGGKRGGWIRAQASGAEGGAGPAFADSATATFDVFTSQFNAATTAVGLLPDTKGQLLTKVQATLSTAIVLRNRLVTIVHAAAPPAPPAAAGRVHAHTSGAEVVAGSPYDAVMPGLVVLLDAELQQMQATADDTSVPQASRDALTKAIASNKQIENLVNQWWPPAPAGADG